MRHLKGVTFTGSTPAGKLRWKHVESFKPLSESELAKRLSTFERGTEGEPFEGEKLTDLMQLCMSSGMFLAHESIDRNGWQDASTITQQMVRRELTEEDMAEIRVAFHAMLARRTAPDSPAGLVDQQPCPVIDCTVCEVAA